MEGYRSYLGLFLKPGAPTAKGLGLVEPWKSDPFEGLRCSAWFRCSNDAISLEFLGEGISEVFISPMLIAFFKGDLLCMWIPIFPPNTVDDEAGMPGVDAEVEVAVDVYSAGRLFLASGVRASLTGVCTSECRNVEGGVDMRGVLNLFRILSGSSGLERELCRLKYEF